MQIRTVRNTDPFKKVITDPIASKERKTQKALKKIKSKFSEQEYKILYPTGSSPAWFYATAKMHKLKNNTNATSYLQH